MTPATVFAATKGGSSPVVAMLVALAIACACSVLAGRKGRNRLAWSFAGFFFSVFALALIAVLPPTRARRAARRSEAQFEPDSTDRPVLDTVAHEVGGEVAPGDLSGASSLANGWPDDVPVIDTYLDHPSNSGGLA